MSKLLQVIDLKKHFPVHSGLFLRRSGTVHAVDGVSFTLAEGKTLGLVGESGCGKSTVGRTLIRLYAPTAGSVIFSGDNVAHLKGALLKNYQRHVQMVFQDPFSSLNPRQTVAHILAAPFNVHGIGNKREREGRVCDLLEKVRLGAWAAHRYPHEFSGGQRQRIAIARAIALNPKLVIADEPVSALDVSVQSQVLNLLTALQDELKLAYIFIAHDLAVVKHISHDIAVMYLGKIVEFATKDELFTMPLHPYTHALLAANPVPGGGKRRRRKLLTGDVPSPLSPPSGCVFRTRCVYAEDRCKMEVPPLQADNTGHVVACHFYRDIQQGLKKKTNPETMYEKN